MDVKKSENRFEIVFERKPLGHEVRKSFESQLFETYWEKPEAYGLFDKEQIIGVVAVNHEEWNNRLRVTDILVVSEHRRRGIGHRLMEVVKETAKRLKARAIVLESQTCNTTAIDFYRKEGFEIVGFDSICYSNSDIENKEVRIEFGITLLV